MKNLTWSKDGEWGIDGVDLAALPPLVYGALYKLHELEHHKEDLLEQLAGMMGVSQWELQDKLECSPRPWHPMEEIPEVFLVEGAIRPSSRKLILHFPAGDVWMGCCEIFPDGPHWFVYPPYIGKPDCWMEIPEVPVSKMNTGEGAKNE